MTFGALGLAEHHVRQWAWRHQLGEVGIGLLAGASRGRFGGLPIDERADQHGCHRRADNEQRVPAAGLAFAGGGVIA